MTDTNILGFDRLLEGHEKKSHEQIYDILQDVILRTDVYLTEGGFMRWGLVEKALRQVVEDALIAERKEIAKLAKLHSADTWGTS